MTSKTEIIKLKNKYGETGTEKIKMKIMQAFYENLYRTNVINCVD